MFKQVFKWLIEENRLKYLKFQKMHVYAMNT